MGTILAFAAGLLVGWLLIPVPGEVLNFYHKLKNR